MTLDTTMRIFDKIDPEQLWAVAMELIVPEDREGPLPKPKIETRGEWVQSMNPPGSGLSAWLMMYVKIGELDWVYPPTREDYEGWYADDYTWDEYVARAGLPYLVELSWDTAYGYQKHPGYGCSNLHYDVTKRVGEWLNSQGIDWIAQNEYTGEWAKTPMPQ